MTTPSRLRLLPESILLCQKAERRSPGYGNRVVHIARPTQCEHDDCREYPELARACFIDRLKQSGPLFGAHHKPENAAPWCGSKRPVVEHSHAWREGLKNGDRVFALLPDFHRDSFVRLWNNERARISEALADATNDIDANPSIDWGSSWLRLCDRCLRSWLASEKADAGDLVDRVAHARERFDNVVEGPEFRVRRVPIVGVAP